MLDKSTLEIGDVEVVNREGSETDAAVIIPWQANTGWGEYTLYRKNGKWLADSECMDSGEDKGFLRVLLDKLVEEVEVTG